MAHAVCRHVDRWFVLLGNFLTVAFEITPPEVGSEVWTAVSHDLGECDSVVEAKVEIVLEIVDEVGYYLLKRGMGEVGPVEDSLFHVQRPTIRFPALNKVLPFLETAILVIVAVNDVILRLLLPLRPEVRERCDFTALLRIEVEELGEWDSSVQR